MTGRLTSDRRIFLKGVVGLGATGLLAGKTIRLCRR